MSIYAGTVDSEEKTAEVAADLGFPVAYGMTRDDASRIDAWWDDNRNFIQPSEFIISGRGRVIGATYSNSPVGRMDPKETLTLLKFLESNRQKREQAQQ